MLFRSILLMIKAVVAALIACLKPKNNLHSFKTEPSLVFRRLGDAENEVRLVGLRFLQEALHVVLDRYFTQNS